MSPTKLKRMDAYIRVSRVGGRDVGSESYITEDIQREKIEAWAKLRDIEIAAWHIDRDRSGAKLSRPGFDTCMARIATGKTQGVVVAAIDRLSRADVADALMIVRQIHDEYHGTLAAVDLGIDPTTEVGEMLLTVLLALARMQWRRYQAAWASAKERAVKRGAHVGPTPIGYVRGADGRLEPDGLASAVMVEAFRLAATKGLRAAMDRLQESDLDHAWTTVTVRRMLANRVYLGEVRLDNLVNMGAHEPLVDLATWTAANKKAGDIHARRPVGHYPLSKIATCGSCGTGLIGTRNGDSVRTYRCRRNHQRAVMRGEHKGCPAPAMATADVLEEYVHAALVRYVATERPDEAVVLVPGSDDGAVERVESALRSAELARDRDATDIRLKEVLGEKFYERMEAHNSAVEEAQENYEAAVEDATGEISWPLADEVATATTADLEELLERVGVTVTVQPGRGNLPERVSLSPSVR